MATGYCNNCHQLITGEYKIIQGKKICKACLDREEALKKTSERKEKELEGLIAFLLSLFHLQNPLESWYNSIESMSKKGYTLEGIQKAIQYCVNNGKNVCYDNWTSLVYIFYDEAEERSKKLNQIVTNNTTTVPITKGKEVHIHNVTKKEKFKDTL